MTAAAAERTVSELLLEWDRMRDRTQQKEFGMSELGVCRRRAGYRLHGVEPSNPGGSVQAVLGTAIHEAQKQILKDLQAAGLIPAEDLIEYEVSFAGILGHLDHYRSASQELHDLKTTTQRWLDRVMVNGPSTSQLWQGNCYGAALIRMGKPVKHVVIDYLARDTGTEHSVRLPLDPQAVWDALDWVRTVQSTELDFLPRDYAPDSSVCQHCPFLTRCWEGQVADRDPRSVLYAESPDAKAWSGKLDRAREDKREAERREAEAKGALDALRPNEDGSATVDVGYDKALRWTVTTTRKVDPDQVRAEYAQIDAQPPMKTSKSVRLEFVPVNRVAQAAEPSPP